MTRYIGGKERAAARVMQAMRTMQKIDVASIKRP